MDLRLCLGTLIHGYSGSTSSQGYETSLIKIRIQEMYWSDSMDVKPCLDWHEIVVPDTI